MKKILAVLLALLLLCASSALAETEIAVSGTGTVYATAELAIINLGVSATKEDVREAQSCVNGALASVRAALEANGVPAEDISTDSVDVYTSYDYNENGESVLRYFASTGLVVRTGDLLSVGTLIDIAIDAGANNLNGVYFCLNDNTPQQEQALRLAIADARRKAEIVADETGLVITSIDTIEEQSCYTTSSDVANYSLKASVEAAFGASTVVRPAKICIDVTVRAVYDAEPAK